MWALFLVVALCASSATVALGQSSDEQKIRELISLNDQGKRLPATSDNIFWSWPFQEADRRAGEAGPHSGRRKAWS